MTGVEFCRYCGAQLPPGMQNCSQCGRASAEAPSASAGSSWGAWKSGPVSSAPPDSAPRSSTAVEIGGFPAARWALVCACLVAVGVVLPWAGVSVFGQSVTAGPLQAVFKDLQSTVAVAAAVAGVVAALALVFDDTRQSNATIWYVMVGSFVVAFLMGAWFWLSLNSAGGDSLLGSYVRQAIGLQIGFFLFVAASAAGVIIGWMGIPGRG